MKQYYNTKIQNINNKDMKQFLYTLDKNLMRVIHANKKIDFEKNFISVKIQNGFTTESIENLLNISCLDSLNYCFIIEYNILYQYQTEATKEFKIYNCDSFANIKNQYYNIKLNNLYYKSNSLDFETLRKYPKIKKYDCISNITFYLIAQNYTELKEKTINYDIDRFKIIEYINYKQKYLLLSDRGMYYYSYDIPDKSGFLNNHYLELKQKADRIRREKNKNIVLNYDFTNILNHAEETKNSIIKEFKNYSLKCESQNDFKCIESLANYTYIKISRINDIINDIKNNKYNSMAEIETDLKRHLQYNFIDKINNEKKYYFYKIIEKSIERSLKENNKIYCYYSLSWTDSDLKYNNESYILTFNKNIQDINFNFTFDLSKEKIYNFEN